MKNHPSSLYVNAKGYEVTRHSYSGSEVLNFCPRKYELERVVGWKEREVRAAMPFGNCIESTARFCHTVSPNENDVATFFDQEWKRTIALPENKDMVCSKVEVSVENLAIVGHEMMRLYAIRVPNFAYESQDILFQQERQAELVPDRLPGCVLIAYLDMIVRLKGSNEKCILDCKTSGAKMPEYVMLDPQLTTYSFVEKCPNVGFLWFQKVSRSIETGSDVAFLTAPVSVAPQPSFAAGECGTVLNIEKGLLGSVMYWVSTAEKYTEMTKLHPDRTKAALETKAKWLALNAVKVAESDLTKQKVGVRLARIPQRQAEQQGQALAQDMLRINSASRANFFPMHGGVRFPNEKCPNCQMRGICSGDDVVRDNMLVRIQTNDFGIPTKDTE